MFYLIIFSIFLAAYAAATTSTIHNTCPYGVLQRVGPYYLQVNNGTCFQFAVHRYRTYDAAHANCLKDRGTLALPKTKSINDYLVDKLINHYGVYYEAWIGLHDKNKEGDFQWEDNTRVDWTNFADGNGPDNSWFSSPHEDCVAISPYDGRWHDFQCREDLLALISGSEPLKMYICQYAPQIKDNKRYYTTAMPTVNDKKNVTQADVNQTMSEPKLNLG